MIEHIEKYGISLRFCPPFLMFRFSMFQDLQARSLRAPSPDRSGWSAEEPRPYRDMNFIDMHFEIYVNLSIF